MGKIPEVTREQQFSKATNGQSWLRIVDRASVALLARCFLHVFESLLLILKLRLQALDPLLFLPLALIPLRAIGHAIHRRKVNGIVEFIDFAL